MSVAIAAPPQLERLRRLLAEVGDLRQAGMILAWDSRVSMPVGGAPARANASATVGRLAHERLTSDEIGRLLDELEPHESELDFDSDDASLIRVTRRDWERERLVPSTLTGELRHSSGIAVAAWDEAKAASDFSLFRPHLERQLELQRRYVDCFPKAEDDYDVLLEDYEPGMTTTEVAGIFDELKRALVPLIEELGLREEIDDSFLHGGYEPAAQEAASRRVLAAFGFEEAEWRLDPTSHPFAGSPGFGDVRLTTHYGDDLHSLFSTMHEFGHGVYEWGVDPALKRSPLGRGTSSSIHESQSRTWENLVGRRRSFWRWFYPELRNVFPDRLGSVDEETFFRAINKVKPSLVRIDADEITYNLHIILRFELEQDLLESRIAVADLPEVWTARMRDYLGVEVPDDARGVLQDMHWGAGLFGYFPTYTLGNVVSVQIWDRVREELGDLDEQFERGEFGPLRDWLREQVYRHGRKFEPQELIRRVTGTSIDPGPYLRYLREKFTPA